MNCSNLYFRHWLFLAVLFCAISLQAQLAVTVSPPKIVGQKTVVKLAMKNNLADKVESARAVCFLLDDQGTMVGQSTQWVIGGTKDRPALEPKADHQSAAIHDHEPDGQSEFQPHRVERWPGG
jgi:hypothetical protein